MLALSACASISTPPPPAPHQYRIGREVHVQSLCTLNSANQLVDIHDPSKGCPSMAYDRPVTNIPGLGWVEPPPDVSSAPASTTTSK